MFVYHPDGRPTGDAFVLFENAELSKLALSKHRQTIGKRYVELFQMNKHEVIQVFTRHTLPNNVFSFPAIRGVRPGGVEPLNSVQNKAYMSNVRNIVRLRGLPYSASVQDILDFLDDFAKYVSPAGVHMVYNYQVSKFPFLIGVDFGPFKIIVSRIELIMKMCQPLQSLFYVNIVDRRASLLPRRYANCQYLSIFVEDILLKKLHILK